MINLEKNKLEKCQSPPFKKTCPWTILPSPFFNFSDSPPPGEVSKIYWWCQNYAPINHIIF